MKKFLFFIYAVAAVALSGCSKDESAHTAATKGMTLSANVEVSSDTKASFSSWQFTFTGDDNIMVNNTEHAQGVYYKFNYNVSSKKFTSSDAETTSETANWYAFFPAASTSSPSFEITGQNGSDPAGFICYAGKQAAVPGGTQDLEMTLSSQTAIIMINCNKGDNIYAKVGTQYIHKMRANYSCLNDNDTPYFTVETSSTEYPLCTAASKGINYIVVPAKTAFTLYKDETLLKTISATQLTGGYYYTLNELIKTYYYGEYSSVTKYSTDPSGKSTIYYNDGAKLILAIDQETSTKDWSSGSDIKGIKSIKSSNGRQNKFVAPDGYAIESVTFYATNNASTNACLVEFNGDVEQEEVTVSKDNGDNPTVIKRNLGGDATKFTFTFTKSGSQALFIMDIELSECTE